MSGKFRREEIVNRILETATERWNSAEVKEIEPTLKMAAESIWKIERFRLESGEEPACLTMISHQVSFWKKRNNEEK